jgi:hypothetical protein
MDVLVWQKKPRASENMVSSGLLKVKYAYKRGSNSQYEFKGGSLPLAPAEYAETQNIASLHIRLTLPPQRGLRPRNAPDFVANLELLIAYGFSQRANNCLIFR